MSTPHELNSILSSPAKKWLTIFGAALLFVLPLSKPLEPAQTVGGTTVSAPVSYRNSWAVVIGINRYTKAPRLNYAVNDAKSVVAAVQKLGFASDKILLLLDQEATKQRIEQLLFGTLRRTTAEDRVFVFFAGHGFTLSLPRGGEEGFLLPVDGDPEDLPPTAIPMEEIRRIARRIPAKHILFAVDACYSGFTITRDVSPAKVDNLYLETVAKEPVVQIITAGRDGEQVLEGEGHGLFTRRILQGLTGSADTDGNGIITAQELATWLETRVVQDSQDRQHPQYSRLDGKGQFVFLVPEELEARRKAEETAKTELAKLEAEIAKLPRPASLPRPPVVLPTAAELPKHKVGDSWTVRFDDGRAAPRTVRAVEKDQYVFEWGLDLWRYYDQNLILTKQITPENGKDWPSYLLKQKTMDFPLSVNKTWEFRILIGTHHLPPPLISIIARDYRVFRFKVLGSETIQTPAGSFGTFKIEERSDEVECSGPCETIDNTTSVRHLWYAPEVKSFVKVKHVSGAPVQGQEPDYELVAFDLK